MRKLNATGFMSNRGRVNCSSFLIHDYLIDWTWGVTYFNSKLIDYDVATNWMNWYMQSTTAAHIYACGDVTDTSVPLTPLSGL